MAHTKIVISVRVNEQAYVETLDNRLKQKCMHAFIYDINVPFTHFSLLGEISWSLVGGLLTSTVADVTVTSRESGFILQQPLLDLGQVSGWFSRDWLQLSRHLVPRHLTAFRSLPLHATILKPHLYLRSQTSTRRSEIRS